MLTDVQEPAQQLHVLCGQSQPYDGFFPVGCVHERRVSAATCLAIRPYPPSMPLTRVLAAVVTFLGVQLFGIGLFLALTAAPITGMMLAVLGCAVGLVALTVASQRPSASRRDRSRAPA